MKIKCVFLYLLFILIVAGCSNPNASQYTDTPTSGEISISVDETIMPLIDSEISTFHGLYKYANITSRYTTEAQAFYDLLTDSARLIVTTRILQDDEKKVFEKIKIIPRITKIAVDAIALIINCENTDTTVTYKQLNELLSGKITHWDEINSNSKLSEINIVFDNKNSSTARYIKEKFNNNVSLPQNCFAVNTNPEVIEYVSKNKNAIGVIGVNWISDGDDPKSLGFLKKINVMGIALPDTMNAAENYYKPYQAYIAQNIYPLCRDIYIVSREARTGLGTGFAAFVASDKGQRIVLKSGLLPATMPVRIVNFRD